MVSAFYKQMAFVGAVILVFGTVAKGMSDGDWLFIPRMMWYSLPFMGLMLIAILLFLSMWWMARKIFPDEED